MSTTESDFEVEFMDNGETTVAVVGDEAYNLSEGEVAFHETSNGLLLITAEDAYQTTYDDDEWIIVDENVPEFVLDALDEKEIRYSDAEAYGFPIELDVGFRSDGALFRSAWQNEVLRPSMNVAKQIEGSIQEVTLTLEIDSDGSITVTDVSLWPDSSNVSVEFDN